MSFRYEYECSSRMKQNNIIWLAFTLIALYTGSTLYDYLMKKTQKDKPYNSEVAEVAEFEDLHFKRVLKSFKEKPRKYFTKINFRSGNQPTVFLYSTDGLKSPFWKSQLRHILKGECPFSCYVTDNITMLSKSDAVVLYLRHLRSTNSVMDILKTRDQTQPWIMLTFEAPPLANSIFKTDYSEFNNFFNRSMMFRRDADIITNHGFVVSKEDANYLPYHWRVPSYNGSTLTLKSSKIVAIISNCKADMSNRLGYIKELQKYTGVDVYGKCGKFKCGKSMYVQHNYKPYDDKCLKMIGTSYMFYLAFENSICLDYGSEKIYNLLYYPIVPIVLGGISYRDILPPNSYINAAKYSPIKLAAHVQFLISNPEEYKNYLKWKEIYTPSTIGGERVMCDMCSRLYDEDFYEYNLIEDFDEWFNRSSKCKRQWTKYNIFNLSYWDLRR